MIDNEAIAAWRILSGGRKCQNVAHACEHFSRSQSKTPFETNCLCCAAKYGGSPDVASKVDCDGSPLGLNAITACESDHIHKG